MAGTPSAAAQPRPLGGNQERRTSMTLFKFVGASRALSILAEGTIRFTQLARMNDPFESYPQVRGFITNDFVQRIVESILDTDALFQQVADDTLRRMYNQLAEPLRLTMTFDSFKSVAQKEIDLELKAKGINLKEFVKLVLKSSQEELVPRIAESIRILLANNLCVLSLAGNNRHPLLWAHYADSYRGVALGFDSTQPFFTGCIKVAYSQSRSALQLTSFPETPKERFELATRILATKSLSWQYEEEYRLLRSAEQLRDTGIFDEAGAPVFTADFPYQSLSTVLLGPSISIEHRDAIVSIVAAKCSRAIAMKSSLSQDEFDISFEGVAP